MYINPIFNLIPKAKYMQILLKDCDEIKVIQHKIYKNCFAYLGRNTNVLPIGLNL